MVVVKGESGPITNASVMATAVPIKDDLFYTEVGSSCSTGVVEWFALHLNRLPLKTLQAVKALDSKLLTATTGPTCTNASLRLSLSNTRQGLLLLLLPGDSCRSTAPSVRIKPCRGV